MKPLKSKHCSSIRKNLNKLKLSNKGRTVREKQKQKEERERERALSANQTPLLALPFKLDNIITT